MYFIHYGFDGCKLLYYLPGTEGIGKLLYVAVDYYTRCVPAFNVSFI